MCRMEVPRRLCRFGLRVVGSTGLDGRPREKGRLASGRENQMDILAVDYILPFCFLTCLGSNRRKDRRDGVWFAGLSTNLNIKPPVSTEATR